MDLQPSPETSSLPAPTVSPASHSSAIRVRRDHGGGGCFTVAALLVFLVAGLLIFGLIFYEPLKYVVIARSWDPVTCTIKDSRAEPVPAPGAVAAPANAAQPDAYRPNISYHYTYGGKFYGPSFRIWFVKPDTDSLKEVQRILARYPAGSSQFCYVNPLNPDFAVLDRGFKPILLVAVIPAAMMFTGALGLVSILLTSIQRRFRPGPPARIDLRYKPSLRARGTRRPIKLRPTRSAAGLPTALLLAVGWNICVYFLVREVLDDWTGGFPGGHWIILTSFTLLLLILGIVIAVIPIVMLLRLLSPYPSIRIESLKVEVGRPAQFTFRLKGWRAWLRRTIITLEGCREETHPRDDIYRTDRDVFYSQTLLDAPRGPAAFANTVSFMIPADQRATFSAGPNAVLWIVRFRLELRHGPDVEDEMELTVLPVTAAQTISVL